MVLVPKAVPRVHVTVASPLLPVRAEELLRVPPPDVITKITLTPGTGRLFASVTTTDGAIGVTCPTTPCWLTLAWFITTTFAAGPPFGPLESLQPLKNTVAMIRMAGKVRMVFTSRLSETHPLFWN